MANGSLIDLLVRTGMSTTIVPQSMPHRMKIGPETKEAVGMGEVNVRMLQLEGRNSWDMSSTSD